MARKRKAKIQEKDLHRFKHFKVLMPVLEGLHHDACARDTAGNRKLHFDQYAGLILLYFFNPIVTSLRGIQQASELDKVQRILDCPRASLGSLSEAARVFDADLLDVPPDVIALIYLAMIACLLIALWTGKKPTLRTYEMICHYFTGLATEEELLAHIKELRSHS